MHADTAASTAVDLIYHTAGGTAPYTASPLDRILRDIHTINQHMFVAPTTYEQSVRVLIGLNPSVPYF